MSRCSHSVGGVYNFSMVVGITCKGMGQGYIVVRILTQGVGGIKIYTLHIINNRLKLLLYINGLKVN